MKNKVTAAVITINNNLRSHVSGIFSLFYDKLANLQHTRIMVKSKDNKTKARRKIGLCLSGGGARGFAHIGAFIAFEELGLRFDMVAGTSVGAICAMLYSSGYSCDEIVERSSQIKTGDLKRSKLVFLPSKTDNLKKMISSMCPVKKLEDLTTTTYIVAVDIKTGEEKRFNSGDIAPIIAGSCAIPYVYYPVDYKNMRLIDGGVKNNIPANVLKENGCDYVIAIDCNCSRGMGTKSSKFTTQLITSFRIMMVNNSREGLLSSDIVICPQLSGFKLLNLDQKDAIIKEGYKAVMQSKYDIIRLFNSRTSR